jgi:hypothetical protein
MAGVAVPVDRLAGICAAPSVDPRRKLLDIYPHATQLRTKQLDRPGGLRDLGDAIKDGIRQI